MAKAGLLFVGTDDGVVLFSDPGGVGRWIRIGQELRGHAVYDVWPAADTPLVVLAAAAGAGLQRSEDGGQSWRQALDADVRAIVGGDRHEPHRMYAGTLDGAVFRSDDAGASWTPCAHEGWASARDARLAVAHADAKTLYLGLSDGSVWLSPDAGAGWAPYGTRLPAGVMSLVEDLSAPGSLYAVANGSLYHCAGDQADWRRVERAPSGNGPLVFLAGKQPVLLLPQNGAIARSDDGGASWATIAPEGDWDGDVTALVAVRYHMDMALAGSAGGQLAQSADRGRTWQVLKQGLGPIRSIAAARLA